MIVYRVICICVSGWTQGVHKGLRPIYCSLEFIPWHGYSGITFGMIPGFLEMLCSRGRMYRSRLI